MLTDATTVVDAPHDAVMWTVAAVAKRDGISKQAVSKRARKFAAEQGLIVERDGQARIGRLNVVQYDQLRGRFADPSKAQAPKPKAEQRPPAADSYDEARRQQAWIDAERSRLSLDEQRGQVVRAETVREAIIAASGEIAAIIDRLPNSADDLSAAVARDGSHGLRVALAKEATRLRSEIAAALRAALAPTAKEVAPTDPVTP